MSTFIPAVLPSPLLLVAVQPTHFAHKLSTPSSTKNQKKVRSPLDVGQCPLLPVRRLRPKFWKSAATRTRAAWPILRGASSTLSDSRDPVAPRGGRASTPSGKSAVHARDRRPRPRRRPCARRAGAHRRPPDAGHRSVPRLRWGRLRGRRAAPVSHRRFLGRIHQPFG